MVSINMNITNKCIQHISLIKNNIKLLMNIDIFLINVIRRMLHNDDDGG